MKFSAKSSQQIEIMREGGNRLSIILRMLRDNVRPGVTGKELDALAESMIRAGGDAPAFLGYRPDFAHKSFPASLCVSVNDEVVHGIPTDNPLQEGDIVGLDLGLLHGGLFTDMAMTVPVGEISETDKKLIETTKNALDAALSVVRAGARLGDIGAAVERVVMPTKFSIVEELGGHGVGEKVHEPPFIAHFGKAGEGVKLEAGQTIAIEPMITAGAHHVSFDKHDGYTVRTKDGSHSAHFEVTLAVTPTGYDLLTPKIW